MRRRVWPLARLGAGALLLFVSFAMASLAWGEGSGTIYRGPDPAGFRGHLEWRTSSYGGGDSLSFNLLRRTLLKVYAQQGESILVASSGIAVAGSPNNGNIRIFNPGQVTGPIGQEVIPALVGAAAPPQQGGFANGFDCVAQRTAAGDSRGRIGSRAEELAGPLAAGGYTPCSYVAPVTGIYNIVMTGPSGDNSDANAQVSGSLENPTAADFGPLQRTSVTAWDVTVRDAGGTNRPGRVFTYYYTATTGGGARPIGGGAYVVTDTGFRYGIFFDGDPFGFVFYVNQLGFQNSDGSPLYRALLADQAAAEQDQNQLRELQGGVSLLPPKYPLFISEPDPLVLDALSIPRTPVAPAINGLTFTGAGGGPSTAPGAGGTFAFTTTQSGVYYLVVSRDGANFDPTEARNRVLRGVAASAGPVTVAWDGRDNEGVAFPAGDFSARAAIQGGEVHFPFLDVENNLGGGPIIQLLNPPDTSGDSLGDCPPWNGGCFGGFYDDRGYRAANGTLVGTAAGGALCPGDAANPRGFGNPPLIAASDQLFGFDTRTSQRGFGFAVDANPAAVCRVDGGHGDKKALDLWTYYPSNVLTVPVPIVDPAAVTLRGLTASRGADGVVVRWETGVELGTRGFHILRSATGDLGDAARVTGALIVARGGPSEGAAYSWTDAGAGDPAVTYTYWLQEVEEGGGTQLYGPIRPSTAPADLPFRVLVPLAAR